MAVALSCTAWALTDLPSVYDATTGFDVQTANDTWSASAGSFFDSGVEPPVANARWSSGWSMHAGTNYYTAKFVYAYPDTSSRIPGTADDLYVLDGNTLEIRGQYDLACDRRFIALPGATVRFMQAGRTFTSSTVEVRSTAARPFTICLRCDNTKASFSALTFPLEGPSTAVLHLPYTFEGGSNRGNVHTFRYTGDASDYEGTIVVDGRFNTNGAGGYMNLALGTDSLGGSVVLTNRAALSKFASCAPSLRALTVSEDSFLIQDATDWTVGDLAFAGGGAVRYSVAKPGVIAVTNSLSLGDAPIVLDFDNVKVFDWSVDKSIAGAAIPTNELFRFAAGVDVSADQFAVTNVARALGGSLPVPYLTTVAHADGTTSLCLTHRPVIVARREMNLNTLDEANAWSDGQKSHGGADYYICWISASQSATGSAMETPIYVQVANEGKNVFGGDSLTIAGGLLWTFAADCQIAHLVLGDKAQVAKNNGAASVMTGTIHVTATSDDTPARIHPSKGSLEIASDIHGSASSVLRFYDAGAVSLSGNNAAYAGRLRFEGAATYSFADGDDLGGGNATFLYNAIDLNGESTVLRAKGDADLANPCRGVLVRQAATISVDVGCTMRLAAPVTFAASLTKAGAGTLALAAAPRFVDGAAETAPLVGANGLAVSEGRVAVAHAEALNGLSLTVAPKAALEIGDEDEGDLHVYGAVMTRGTDPLAAAETVPVRLQIRVDEARTTRVYTRGVMTFATRAEAESALAKLRVRTMPRGYAAALSVIEGERNGQTVYTVRATCERSGLALLIR